MTWVGLQINFIYIDKETKKEYLLDLFMMTIKFINKIN